MLYKKYHRNYIRQFKIGTKLATIKAEVDKLVEIFDCTSKKCVGIFVKREGYNDLRDGFVLIYPNGRFNYKIKIKKDVI